MTTFTEAPASLNIRFRVNGYDAQLTLRNENGIDLLGKLETVLTHLEEVGAQPCNGHKPAPPTPPERLPGYVVEDGPDPADSGERRYCRLHDAELKHYEKDGRSWWSHKAEDGQWCKGK